jgi:hypothetical protein
MFVESQSIANTAIAHNNKRKAMVETEFFALSNLAIAPTKNTRSPPCHTGPTVWMIKRFVNYPQGCTAIGIRHPVPKARSVIFNPGGACLRLNSAREINFITLLTTAESCPASII